LAVPDPLPEKDSDADARESAGSSSPSRMLLVAGIRRATKQPAHLIYRRLRARGYEVFAVKSQRRGGEGRSLLPDIVSIPHRLDGVVTTPAVAEDARPRAFPASAASEPEPAACPRRLSSAPASTALP
jgi:hypothetical protein